MDHGPVVGPFPLDRAGLFLRLRLPPLAHLVEQERCRSQPYAQPYGHAHHLGQRAVLAVSVPHHGLASGFSFPSAALSGSPPAWASIWRGSPVHAGSVPRSPVFESGDQPHLPPGLDHRGRGGLAGGGFLPGPGPEGVGPVKRVEPVPAALVSGDPRGPAVWDGLALPGVPAGYDEVPVEPLVRLGVVPAVDAPDPVGHPGLFQHPGRELGRAPYDRVEHVPGRPPAGVEESRGRVVTDVAAGVGSHFPPCLPAGAPRPLSRGAGGAAGRKTAGPWFPSPSGPGVSVLPVASLPKSVLIIDDWVDPEQVCGPALRPAVCSISFAIPPRSSPSPWRLRGVFSRAPRLRRFQAGQAAARAASGACYFSSGSGPDFREPYALHPVSVRLRGLPVGPPVL